MGNHPVMSHVSEFPGSARLVTLVPRRMFYNDMDVFSASFLCHMTEPYATFNSYAKSPMSHAGRCASPGHSAVHCDAGMLGYMRIQTALRPACAMQNTSEFGLRVCKRSGVYGNLSVQLYDNPKHQIAKPQNPNCPGKSGGSTATALPYY